MHLNVPPIFLNVIPQLQLQNFMLYLPHCLALKAVDSSLIESKYIRRQIAIAQTSTLNPCTSIMVKINGLKLLYEQNLISRRIGYRPIYFSISDESVRCFQC